jgi:hypothetical protein
MKNTGGQPTAFDTRAYGIKQCLIVSDTKQLQDVYGPRDAESRPDIKLLHQKTKGTPIAFNFHAGDVANSVVIGPAGHGMSFSFNPVALFAVDADACMGLVQQAAMVNLPHDDLALAKVIGLRIAESQTPSVLALVEAWKHGSKSRPLPILPPLLLAPCCRISRGKRTCLSSRKSGSISKTMPGPNST